MKKILIILSIFAFIINTICIAAQDKNNNEYYRNLRNCVKYQNEIFEIHGFEGDYCKMTMTLTPPSGSAKTVFTYKYPKKILNQICNDAQVMSNEALKAKWEPREEEFCTSIIFDGKLIYSK